MGMQMNQLLKGNDVMTATRREGCAGAGKPLLVLGAGDVMCVCVWGGVGGGSWGTT
jgi:hypothetical protein